MAIEEIREQTVKIQKQMNHKLIKFRKEVEEKASKNTRKLKTKLEQTKLQDTGTLERIKEKF